MLTADSSLLSLLVPPVITLVKPRTYLSSKGFNNNSGGGSYSGWIACCW